ncbi:integrase [Kitasatospora hibisci]|uniref:integrase n=1 Tax=Kitasatospora hibisci TaxID=3369522 RepID=UPI0037552D84
MTTLAVGTSGPATSPFIGLDLAEALGLRMASGSARPRFDQDVWDFSGMIDAPAYMTPGDKIADFRPITNPLWRTVARTYLAARLLPRHPSVATLPHAYRTPLSVKSISTALGYVIRWLNYLTDQGVTSLTQVHQHHCDTFLSEVSTSRLSPGTPVHLLTVTANVAAAQALVPYSAILPDAYPKGFQPWGQQSATSIAGYRKPDANSTPVVPDEMLRPLLANCLYLIDTIGPHLATEATKARAAKGSIKLAGGYHLNQAQLRHLVADIEDRRAGGQPAPEAYLTSVNRRRNQGWSEDDLLLHVSLIQVLVNAGLKRNLSPAQRDQLRPLLEDWVRECGIEKPWCRDSPLVPCMTGEGRIPWSEPVGIFALKTMIRVVIGAAYVLTSALSGMRHSELVEIAAGSRVREEPTASLVRYRVNSRLIKHRDLGGVPESWVVIEDVYRALGIAEQVAGAKLGQLLFTGAHFTSGDETDIRRWMNGPAGQRLGLEPVPDGPLHATALRRTLSRAIAQRPHGLLAGKWHLKHVSVTTTEGYAARPGGHQARFLTEVRAEEETEHLRLTAAAYEDYRRGVRPSGNGARELLAVFQHADAALDGHRPGDARVIDDRRVEALLKARAKTLHIGVANYCWFTDPAKALCLSMAGTPDAREPLIGMCDSARCGQATHHPHHRAMWADHVEQTRAVFLGNPRISPIERARAQEIHDRAMRIVQAIDSAQETTSDQ